MRLLALTGAAGETDLQKTEKQDEILEEMKECQIYHFSI